MVADHLDLQLILLLVMKEKTARFMLQHVHPVQVLVPRAPGRQTAEAEAEAEAEAVNRMKLKKGIP